MGQIGIEIINNCNIYYIFEENKIGGIKNGVRK